MRAFPYPASLAVVAAAVMTGAAPALAEEVPPPLRQLGQGVPISHIQCAEDMQLVLSPGQRPACVTPDTAQRLEGRGWETAEAAAPAPSAADAGAPPSPLHVAADVDSPGIPPAIAESSNAFALDFHRQAYPGAAADSANVFFSPLGMYGAFSMLYEGARGETAGQLRGTFGFDSDAASRHNATAHMMADINAGDEHSVLEIANSMWLKEGFDPYDSYVDVVRGTYLADIERVDFTGDGVDRINAWVSDKTREKIEEVLTSDDVSTSTRVALVNTMYFKGTWMSPFPEENTYNSTFYSDGQELKAEFMYMDNLVSDYADLGDLKLLKLPYKGDRLSMLLALPAERDGLGRLQEGLDAGTLREWAAATSPAKIEVWIPKFETKTSYDLVGYMENLGTVDVFNPGSSDLTGIAGTGPDNLYVSAAVHDAYVKVDESGTEAGAATAVVVDDVSAARHEFLADHPFMFLIMDDESGTILFMGSMLDPARIG